jgi:dihydrodipicolinate synthase/N-acetylneuraminate lyase
MNRENVHDWLRGPVVAVATPFKEDFSLDLAALQDNIRFMIEGGVRTGDGVLLVGAAGGEFPSLNADERKAIMDASIEAAQGQVPIMTSIQHTDFRVILDLANYAEEAGVAAAQLGQLYYYPSTERDIYNLFRMVADHSGVTLMVYHTPWDGIHMSRELLTRLTSIPTVGAIKWASADMAVYRDTILAFKDNVAMVDNEGHHLLSHMYGSRAFVTHLSGFWPQYPRKIWRQLEAGQYDDAHATLAAFKWKWSAWVDQAVKYTEGEGPFIKAAMEAVGLKVGPPRPPYTRLSPELLADLHTLLRAASVPQV